MTITIEEGKWYARADDLTPRGPTEPTDNKLYPWRTKSHHGVYTSGGLFYRDAPGHPNDLVREVPAPGTEPAPAAAEPEWAAKVEAEAAEERLLVLEEGKCYRTRDGRKAGPMESHIYGSKHPWLGFSESNLTNGDIWAPDGTHGDDQDQHGPRIAPNEPALDIVAEWVEEPAQDPLLRAMLDDGIVTEPVADIKTHIADEAKRIVSGARRSAYGAPEANFERIARFWQAYFESTGRGSILITAADVSPMMRLMKEARLCESPQHLDSFIDLIGYAMTGAEVNGVKPPSA
jgi:hypothetical protein